MSWADRGEIFTSDLISAHPLFELTVVHINRHNIGVNVCANYTFLKTVVQMKQLYSNGVQSLILEQDLEPLRLSFRTSNASLEDLQYIRQWYSSASRARIWDQRVLSRKCFRMSCVCAGTPSPVSVRGTKQSSYPHNAECIFRWWDRTRWYYSCQYATLWTWNIQSTLLLSKARAFLEWPCIRFFNRATLRRALLVNAQSPLDMILLWDHTVVRIKRYC